MRACVTARFTGAGFVQVALDPTEFPFMPSSGVEMLIVAALSLRVHSNVPANKMFILIDIGAKGTIILIR
jgi:hypothetical protein